MNQKGVLITAATVLFFFLVFSFTESPSGGNHLEVTGKERKNAVKECLTVRVMDNTLQGDGKVAVVYTNICNGYEFRLTRTGLKYETLFGKKKSLIRKSPVAIPSNNTENLTLSIPIGIYPKVAYPFADDVKVFTMQ